MKSNSQLPQEGFIRLKQLIGDGDNSSPIIPVSAATIWNWVRDGKFPKPVSLTKSITAWRVSDIRQYINAGGQSNV